MDADTNIGGGRSRFPDTRLSAIALAQSPDEAERRQAHGAIIEAYWKPVYKYLRLRRNLNNESAKDLTQGFFVLAIEKRFFDTYDPGKGSFRTYLRTCVDAFVSNEQKRAGREKRGGGAALLSLDFKTAEGELLQHDIANDASVDEFFHQEWVRSVFGLAIEDLRIVCKARGKDIAILLDSEKTAAIASEVLYRPQDFSSEDKKEVLYRQVFHRHSATWSVAQRDAERDDLARLTLLVEGAAAVKGDTPAAPNDLRLP